MTNDLRGLALVAAQRKSFDELNGYSIRARRGIESVSMPRL